MPWDKKKKKKKVMKCLSNIDEISDHGEGLRCGVFTAILVNKDVAVFSDSSPPAPKGTQEGEEHRDLAAIRLQPPPTLSPEELGIQRTGPRELRCGCKEQVH